MIIELGTNYFSFKYLFPINNTVSYGYITKKNNEIIIPLNKYSTRLKAMVNYKKMFIVEINKINFGTLLEKMTSNFHQINNGKKRKPKFKLTKNNIDNAIIYSYIPKKNEI